MDTYYFSGTIAEEYSVDEAALLQILYRITLENQSMCVIEDDLYWFPCAMREWSEYVPFWHPRKTDRIIKHCLSNRTVYMGQYDTDERRRRGWYAINKRLIPYLDEVERNKPNKSLR